MERIKLFFMFAYFHSLSDPSSPRDIPGLWPPIKKGWGLPAMKEGTYDIGEVPDIKE